MVIEEGKIVLTEEEESRRISAIFRDCYESADGLLELCSKCGFVKRRVISGHSDCGSYTPSVSPGYPPMCQCEKDMLGDLAVEMLFWMIESKSLEFTKTLLEKYRKDSKRLLWMP